MSRVVVTGASGNLGSSLCRKLVAGGHTPVALSRDPASARGRLPREAEAVAWPAPDKQPPPSEALAGASAVINLIGEPVAQRWSDSAKQRIRSSRVATTAMLVEGLQQLSDAQRPAVLVSQSATGYYGPCGSAELTESAPAGHDFLAGVVTAWEQAALAAASSMRVVVTRTGVVLSPDGGALAKMLPFFRAGVGGPVAGGHQYVPWVHVDDVCAALIFCAQTNAAQGPVNLTAPRPVDNAELSRALGKVLHRPAVLPVPGFAIKLLYGEMAEMVVSGQRAVPARLQELGFEFSQTEIEPALRSVL
jgi:uncharacterized protein